MFQFFIWIIKRILVFTQLNKLFCFSTTPAVNRLFRIATIIKVPLSPNHLDPKVRYQSTESNFATASQTYPEIHR
jgi:hypothetical protein